MGVGLSLIGCVQDRTSCDSIPRRCKRVNRVAGRPKAGAASGCGRMGWGRRPRMPGKANPGPRRSRRFIPAQPARVGIPPTPSTRPQRSDLKVARRSHPYPDRGVHAASSQPSQLRWGFPRRPRPGPNEATSRSRAYGFVHCQGSRPYGSRRRALLQRQSRGSLTKAALTGFCSV